MGAQHNHKKKQPALTQTTAATPDATDIAPTGPTFVSRGGHKLDHALKEFGLDIRGKLCADLGCSTGGFSDCLLQAGAARVFSVDTAYGILAWKLRKDPRVTVMERTNALHAAIPAGGVDVVVADLSWTPQRLILPVAAKWLAGETSSPRFLISLIKPHYELKDRDANAVPKGGVLPDAEAEQIALGMAEFLFAGKRYKEAEKTLVYRLFENTFMSIAADVLLIKIYYETKNDLLETRMKALDQKVRRTKYSQEKKENYLNFLRKLDKIIKYAWQPQSNKRLKLIEEIKTIPGIVSREWLLEKLS